MRSILLSVSLLCLSNIFMTFAWYAHLKELSHKPWIVAALISWGIAFFEYMLQVPANRIGYTPPCPSANSRSCRRSSPCRSSCRSLSFI